MSKQEKIEGFDPNGVGAKNGRFLGLPFEEHESEIVLLPVPWEVTTSYRPGTATAARNILEASSQLDLYDSEVADAWKMGIYLREPDMHWLRLSNELRERAAHYIYLMEHGHDCDELGTMAAIRDRINQAGEELNAWVKQSCAELLEEGKMVGLVGGEHSSSLGFLQALQERGEPFGLLHIDAHFDLRKAYQEFTYSHASFLYNALSLDRIQQVLSIGVRDFCQAERDLATSLAKRMTTIADQELRRRMLEGKSFASIIRQGIDNLPDRVYITFDIDGLEPSLCPHTGTPVPGGLRYQEALFILNELVRSGRTIIGFDLVEVAGQGHEWDGNVGARLLYKLSALMGKSQGRLPTP